MTEPCPTPDPNWLASSINRSVLVIIDHQHTEHRRLLLRNASWQRDQVLSLR
jgi:hypothetical protein